MKSTIKLAFAALVITLASCTSKPAENTATETQESEAPATELTEPAVVDSADVAPADSVVIE